MSNEEVAGFGVKAGCIRTGAHEPIVLISAQGIVIQKAAPCGTQCGTLRLLCTLYMMKHCAYSVYMIK